MIRNKYRASLNIRRAKDREKIFRQMKQNSACVVHPTRRVFVKRPQGRDDGKDSADSPCDKFLEVPVSKSRNQRVSFGNSKRRDPHDNGARLFAWIIFSFS